MKKTAVALAVFVFVGFAALAASRKPQAASRELSAAAEVERVERDLVAAISRTDLATYDRIVADDYVAYSDNGAALTKPEIMASYRSGTRKYVNLAISDVMVDVFGETAILSAKTSGTRVENGAKPVPNTVRYFRVFVRRQGQWRAVMQIVQPLPAEAGTKKQ